MDEWLIQQVKQDLHFDALGINDPKPLLYSAIADWIRVITLDTDPLLGSNKTGVTRSYLEERAATVLIDLAHAFGGNINGLQSEQITSSIQWMISQMIKLGELWEPAEGVVICAPTYPIWSWNGFVRYTGLPPNNGLKTYRIGLCHYQNPPALQFDIKKFEMSWLQTAYAVSANSKQFPLLSGDAYYIFLTFKQIDIQDGCIKYRTKLDSLKEDAQRFLLSASWPLTACPLGWDKASIWAVPEKICESKHVA